MDMKIRTTKIYFLGIKDIISLVWYKSFFFE